MKKVLLLIPILILFFIPLRTDNTSLENYGVKDRSISSTIISKVISINPIVKNFAYKKLETLIPYIKDASKKYDIPENIIAAILYTEIIHKSWHPIDLKTFGIAQLGLEELKLQNLPMDKKILNNDEVSVWLLTAKLRRLQNQTGSLRDAIILHNGYYDYYDLVSESSKDPKILIFFSKNTHDYFRNPQ